MEKEHTEQIEYLSCGNEVTIERSKAGYLVYDTCGSGTQVDTFDKAKEVATEMGCDPFGADDGDEYDYNWV